MSTLQAIFNNFNIQNNTVYGIAFYEDMPNITVPVSDKLPIDGYTDITEEYIINRLKEKAPPRSWFEEQFLIMSQKQAWLSQLPSFLLEKSDLTIVNAVNVEWYETTVLSEPYFDNGMWKRNSEVISLVNTMPLEGLKTRFKSFLASYRYDIETKGLMLGDTLILTDRESQASVTGGWVKAKDNPNTVIDWKGADGWITLDANTMILIGDLVFAHVQACFAREGQLSRQIDNTLTAEELILIDYTTGWPS